MTFLESNCSLVLSVETVSEESEEEGSTSTVGRQGDEEYSDGYPRPYPYPDEYQGDKQNVEADVHSNGEVSFMFPLTKLGNIWP